ncbi:MAG: N-glycosylase/DNA lyase [Candidatus Micrarchaeota archaeon]|nr:N-glycosylase/DNA lyase [Candidatus Micrarchaeota archaeon]
MEVLVQKVNSVKRTAISKLVDQRSEEFEAVFADDSKVFSELCFCLTTANSSAEMGIKVQNALQGRLDKLTRKELSVELRKLGYRFYNKRAEYIDEAKQWRNIKNKIKEFQGEIELREWLVENILGFGYKEASHFLRNIGFKELAILDRHVLRTMHEHGMIKELPKTLNRKRYLEYEGKLEEICKRTNLNQSQLDLYLWYMKTGKVLK